MTKNTVQNEKPQHHLKLLTLTQNLSNHHIVAVQYRPASRLSQYTLQAKFYLSHALKQKLAVSKVNSFHHL